MRKMLAGVLLVVWTCGVMGAAEGPWAATVAFEEAAKIEDVQAQNGDAPVVVERAFPVLERREGKVPVLRFRARIQAPQPSGWSNYLSLAVNGKALAATTSGGTQRLINRAPVFRNQPKPDAEERKVSWWGKTPSGVQALIIFFGPGGAVTDPRIRSDAEELYWYVLDLSDAAAFKDAGVAADAVNKVEFTSHLLLSNVKNKPMTLLVEEASVGYIAVQDWRARLDSYPKAK